MMNYWYINDKFSDFYLNIIRDISDDFRSYQTIFVLQKINAKLKNDLHWNHLSWKLLK